LVLPAASEKAVSPTHITPFVVLSSVGVNVAVYSVPETSVRALRLPPLTLISPKTKSVDASERVKVTVVVSPFFNDAAADVIAIVGLSVSTESVKVLFA